MTPRVKVHEDGRMAVYDPVTREQVQAVADGKFAGVLWGRFSPRPWRLFWDPDATQPDLGCRLTEDEVAGWSEAALVPQPPQVREPPRVCEAAHDHRKHHPRKERFQ